VIESHDATLRTSISEFLDSLFGEELGDHLKVDPQVVKLVKEHLGQRLLYPRAGLQLAEALIQLAKARAGEGNQ
jgi:hypothetical protein